MQKRLMMLCALCLMSVAGCLAAEKVKIDGLWYWLNSYKGVLTADFALCTGGSYSGDIVIPSSVTYDGLTYKVTKISSYAFNQDSGVTSVSIPNTVTSIGDEAFGGCSGLKTLTIPSSVTEIGEAAFSGCAFNPLVIEGSLKTYSTAFTKMSTSSVVFCKTSEVNKVKQYFKGEVYVIGTVSEVVREDIRYRLLSNNKTAIVLGTVDGGANYAKGTLVIPDEVVEAGVTYKVTKVSPYAFYKDMELSSVVLGSNVAELGSYAFAECGHLLNVKLSGALKKIPGYAFYNCYSLGEVEIPDGVEEIESYAFQNCRMLGSSVPLKISSSVWYIRENAFDGCRSMANIEVDEDSWHFTSRDGVLYSNSLSSLVFCPPSNTVGAFTLPDEVRTIENSAFKDCTGITSITMSDKVTSIGNFAFRGCYNLWSIRLSQQLESLGAAALAGCKGLVSIVLPRSLKTVGGDVFSGCQLRLMVILGPVDTSYGSGKGVSASEFRDENLREGAAIYTYYPDAIASNVNCPVYQLAEAPMVENLKTYLKGVEFDVPVQGKGVPSSLSVGGIEVSPSADGHYFIKGLPLRANGVITGTFRLEHHDYNYDDLLGSFSLVRPQVVISGVICTQTTVRGTVTASSDITCQPDEVEAYRSTDSRCAVSGDGSFLITDLPVISKVTVYAYALYGDQEVSTNTTAYTQGTKPSISVLRTAPTSLELKGFCPAGDAKVVASEFNGTAVKGDTYKMTGLDPKTSYSVTYTVKYATGGKESVNKSFSTADLKLESQNPKVTKRGEAVVCATTNMADDETLAGFEWRKTEAPDVVPSKSALAVIYDGTLEGVIKNLDPTSFYKVRPFYQSNSGKKYYGEWIGIDPSDFSYFEPTVHTYASINVDNNIVTISGYVLQGSDDILSQGFEYWINGTATRAPGQNVIKVTASGLRMSVELSDLQPNREYGYRAFVTTSRGTTYGEERTFMSPDVMTGISSVTTVKEATVGVYDLRGRLVRSDASSLDGLPKGLYIVGGKKIIKR